MVCTDTEHFYLRKAPLTSKKNFLVSIVEQNFRAGVPFQKDLNIRIFILRVYIDRKISIMSGFFNVYQF